MKNKFALLAPAAVVVASMAFTACGGGDDAAGSIKTEKVKVTTTTEAPTSSTVKPEEIVAGYFNVLAENGDASPHAAPGSTAETYAQYLRGIVLADPNRPKSTVEVDNSTVTMRYDNMGTKVENIFTDFQVDESTGKLAGFTVDGKPLQMYGRGSTATSCGVTVTIVGARRNDSGLFITYTVQNGTGVEANSATSSYKDAAGVVTEASNSSGAYEFLPQSTSYGSELFTAAEPGGTFHWEGYSDDDNCDEIVMDLPVA